MVFRADLSTSWGFFEADLLLRDLT